MIFPVKKTLFIGVFKDYTQVFLKFKDQFSKINFSGDLHKLISELRSIENYSSISDDITNEVLDEIEKNEREKGNKGRKKKSNSRTENNNISMTMTMKQRSMMNPMRKRLKMMSQQWQCRTIGKV